MSWDKKYLDINIQYFQYESGKGHYHNPNDVTELLTCLLNGCNLEEEERIKCEDEIHETALPFWDM